MIDVNTLYRGDKIFGTVESKFHDEYLVGHHIYGLPTRAANGGDTQSFEKSRVEQLVADHVKQFDDFLEFTLPHSDFLSFSTQKAEAQRFLFGTEHHTRFKECKCSEATHFLLSLDLSRGSVNLLSDGIWKYKDTVMEGLELLLFESATVLRSIRDSGLSLNDIEDLDDLIETAALESEILAMPVGIHKRMSDQTGKIVTTAFISQHLLGASKCYRLK